MIRPKVIKIIPDFILRIFLFTLISSLGAPGFGRVALAASHPPFKPLVEVRREYLRDQLAKAFGHDSATTILCKDLAKEGFVGMAKVGVGVALTVGIYKLLSYFEMEEKPIEKACEILLPGLLGAALLESGSEIKGSFEDFRNGHFRHRIKALRSVYRKIQRDFQEEDEALPVSLRRWLDRLDEAFAAEVTAEIPEYNKLLRILERRELIVRSLPVGPANLEFGLPAQAEEKGQLEMRIQGLLEDLPTGVRPAIGSVVQLACKASYSFQEERPHVLLSGKTNATRTALVRKVGEALGLPLCRLQVSDFLGDRLLGKGGDALLDFKLSDEEILGKLGVCFRDSGVTNPILVLDGVLPGGLSPESAEKIFLLLDHRNYGMFLPAVDFVLDVHRAPIFVQVSERGPFMPGLGVHSTAASPFGRAFQPELEARLLSSPEDFWEGVFGEGHTGKLGSDPDGQTKRPPESKEGLPQLGKPSNFHGVEGHF